MFRDGHTVYIGQWHDNEKEGKGELSLPLQQINFKGTFSAGVVRVFWIRVFNFSLSLNPKPIPCIIFCLVAYPQSDF
jgi:hypothetical protein